MDFDPIPRAMLVEELEAGLVIESRTLPDEVNCRVSRDDAIIVFHGIVFFGLGVTVVVEDSVT